MSTDTPNGMDDEQLLGELRRLAARADAAPVDLLEAGRATLTWRRVDAELAELLHDSAVENHDALVVRGIEADRLLSFEAPELTAEVQVSEPEAGARRLVGQLMPPAAATIEVRHASGSVRVETDEAGRFAADVPAGHISLRIELPGGGAVETAWVDI